MRAFSAAVPGGHGKFSVRGPCARCLSGRRVAGGLIATHGRDRERLMIGPSAAATPLLSPAPARPRANFIRRECCLASSVFPALVIASPGRGHHMELEHRPPIRRCEINGVPRALDGGDMFDQQVQSAEACRGRGDQGSRACLCTNLVHVPEVPPSGMLAGSVSFWAVCLQPNAGTSFPSACDEQSLGSVRSEALRRDTCPF